MFQALFNSLSGLFSFSRSLDTVSNNVSNMNTPGFRGSDSFFSNVAGGNGTSVMGEGIRTSAGSFKQTGERTHLAVDGNGFFVLRNDAGELFYTRAGQFRFVDGVLEDAVTGYTVMGMGENGELVEIDLNDHQFLMPEPTTAVNLTGSINAEDTEILVEDVLVYDAGGATRKVTLKITKNVLDPADPDAEEPEPGSYTVTVILEDGTELDQQYEVRFSQQGGLETPLEDWNTISVALQFGESEQTIEFSFGAPGSTGGVFLSSFTGDVSGRATDGHGRLNLSDFGFDETGVLQMAFGPAGAETEAGVQLALASFRSESTLQMIEGRLVVDTANSDVTLGRPNAGSFGRIKAGSLELANVDLTQEFADMIIIQRGYQASSRVMTVGNEMIEQLYNSTRGG